jgi:putative ABC transport system permease protein
MWLLTLRDLQYRKVRVIVVVVLAAVVMALLFLMTGLVNQFRHEPYDATAAIGADHWVLPEGMSGPFTSGGAVPVALVAELGPTARPVVLGRGTIAPSDDPAESAEVVVVGGELADLQTTMAAPELVEGRSVGAAGEVVVDRATGFSVGDLVRLGPAELEVVGLTSRTSVLAGVPLVFVEVGVAQDLAFQNRTVATGVLVDGVAPAPPAGTVVRSSDEVAEDALGPMKDAISSIDLVRALMWLVTAVIIGAVVFLSALERQRDFAILRAMGPSRRARPRAVVVQAVLIAVLAAVVAMVLQRLLVPLFPLPVIVPGRAFWTIPVGAVIAALVAGAAGLRKVATVDPAAAFSGPGT